MMQNTNTSWVPWNSNDNLPGNWSGRDAEYIGIIATVYE
jgi:hypothetical protein